MPKLREWPDKSRSSPRVSVRYQPFQMPLNSLRSSARKKAVKNVASEAIKTEPMSLDIVAVDEFDRPETSSGINIYYRVCVEIVNKIGEKYYF